MRGQTGVFLEIYVCIVVPVGLYGQFFLDRFDDFGLQVFIIVSGIPHPVLVPVIEYPQFIFSRYKQFGEEYPGIPEGIGFYDLLTLYKFQYRVSGKV